MSKRFFESFSPEVKKYLTDNNKNIRINDFRRLKNHTKSRLGNTSFLLDSIHLNIIFLNKEKIETGSVKSIYVPFGKPKNWYGDILNVYKVDSLYVITEEGKLTIEKMTREELSEHEFVFALTSDKMFNLNNSESPSFYTHNKLEIVEKMFLFLITKLKSNLLIELSSADNKRYANLLNDDELFDFIKESLKKSFIDSNAFQDGSTYKLHQFIYRYLHIDSANAENNFYT